MQYFVTYKMIFESTIIVSAADKEAAANKAREIAGTAADPWEAGPPDEVEIVEVKEVK